jgi:hypothetical protein
MLETTPVDEEPLRFDVHIIRCFLLQRFGDNHVDLAAIKPEAVRRFVTDQSTHYGSPDGVAKLIAALRALFPLPHRLR